MTCVSFKPDNPNIVVTSSSHQTIKTWDITSGSCLSTLKVDAGSQGVKSVSFSPKGDMVAAGCFHGKIYFVDVAAGEIKSSLRGRKQINSVAFSPDGSLIAAGDGGYGDEGTIRLYNAATGDPFGSPLRGHRYAPSLSKECFLSFG